MPSACPQAPHRRLKSHCKINRGVGISRNGRYPAISLQSAEVGVSKNDLKSVAYEIRTKSAKSGGLETNGPRERISGLRQAPPQCGGFHAKARRYWAFGDAESQRRKLVADRLAEGERLGSNGLR